MSQRIIFHVDANSAFLSWTAAYRVLVLGQTEDLREIPSAVCGDKASRKGVILAKSGPAKKFGVQTGEPLFQALGKCPGLKVVSPDYDLYTRASRALVGILREFTPLVEQYSIDEAWADMTGTVSLYGSAQQAAETLKNRVKKELGFTVNVGISSNKMLAKMAGDFEKPDRVHTLFPEEIPQKLWPLGVRELFSIGPATEKKLRLYGITTVGELARTDVAFLREKLGKPGESIWHLANGRCPDVVNTQAALNKGYGNSMTTPADVCDTDAAQQVLLALCETVGARLRKDRQTGACITVQLRTKDFTDFSHQKMLPSSTAVTQELYHAACEVLAEMWKNRLPLRQLGVQVTRLSQSGGYRQYSLFDAAQYDRLEKMDAAMDAIREKFGETALFRARFLGRAEQHMAGGLAKERRTGVTKEVTYDEL